MRTIPRRTTFVTALILVVALAGAADAKKLSKLRTFFSPPLGTAESLATSNIQWRASVVNPGTNQPATVSIFLCNLQGTCVTGPETAMCQERELQPGEVCFAEHGAMTGGGFIYARINATGPGRDDLRGALHARWFDRDGFPVQFTVDFR
jgi:hypothetical protein